VRSDDNAASFWRAAFPAPAAAPAALRKHLSEHAIAAGAYLFHQGDPATAVFAIAAGIMRLERHTADGHTIVIHRARAGESLAEAALYADGYHCHAVAETPARVIVYPKDVMLTLLQTDAAIADSVTAALARHVQGLRTRLELRNLRPAKTRVLAYLELLADDDGNMTCIEAAKVTRWPDRTVLAGMRYRYYVRAYDASGRAGPPSNSVVVEPPVPDFGGRDAA